MRKIEALGEFRIKLGCGHDDYVVSASKIEDGVVNFVDSACETIVQKRVKFEENMILKSMSEEQLKDGIKLLNKELKRRKENRK